MVLDIQVVAIMFLMEQDIRPNPDFELIIGSYSAALKKKEEPGLLKAV